MMKQETAHDSKDNTSNWATMGPAKDKPRMKVLGQDYQWPTVVQLKRKP